MSDEKKKINENKDVKNNNVDETLNIPSFKSKKDDSKVEMSRQKRTAKKVKATPEDLDKTMVIKKQTVNTEDAKPKAELPKQENLDETRMYQATENVDETKVIVDNGLENLRAAEKDLEQAFMTQKGKEPLMKKNGKLKYTAFQKINVVLTFGAFMMIAGLTAFLIFWMSMSAGSPKLDLELLLNPGSSKILDSKGEIVFDLALFGEEGAASKDIPYEQMPQNIVDAFVSIEDSRFFSHNGFDIPRFTKAIFENLAAGDFGQGGSTLAMQLIKDSHLSADKKIKRKVREINLAIELDNELSKEEIFQMYVNKINYGAGNTRGLENASQYFFGKSARELNLSESALLAGIINAPGEFSPINNLEKATKRRNVVLDLMVYHGYISQSEADLAKAIKVEDMLTETEVVGFDLDNPVLGYVNVVIEEVKDKYGIDIINTPVIVHTFLDMDIQNEVAAIEKDDAMYPDERMQSSIVVGDNDTGEVVAIGCGRGPQVMRGSCKATRMYRQPGSVLKPIISYALAFEHLGWSTSHVVEDRPIQIGGTSHILGNANGTYQGQVTLKNAVANSLNTPAYAALQELENTIGVDSIVSYLSNLGFKRIQDNPGSYNTQVAIGASVFEVSPMEVFGAQSVMMNGGYYIEPHTVKQIELANKEIVDEPSKYSKTRVISEETAYLVSVLEDYNVSSGIINRMNVLGGRNYPVYAKTGTTDYGDTATQFGIPVGAGKDQWMFASSRKYTSVVWMGYDQAGEGNYWHDWKYNMNPLGKMNIRLLNVIHANRENPGRVERPGGISNITHVLAVFPYASPIEGMESKYITTGEINSKFMKNLVSLADTSLNIEPVDSFSATITGNGANKVLNLQWSEYPADGSIKGATYDISLGGVRATGRYLFHPSWIFGSMQYKATIYVNGTKLDDISSAASAYSNTYAIPGGSSVRVCGFYGNNKQNGTEQCHVIEVPADASNQITIPNFNTYGDVEGFVSSNGLTKWSRVDTATNDASLDGKVISVTYNGSSIIGQSYKEDVLKAMNVRVTVYKYNGSANNITLPGGNYANFISWAGSNGLPYEAVPGATNGQQIDYYMINNNRYEIGTVVDKTTIAKITVVLKP